MRRVGEGEKRRKREGGKERKRRKSGEGGKRGEEGRGRRRGKKNRGEGKNGVLIGEGEKTGGYFDKSFCDGQRRLSDGPKNFSGKIGGKMRKAANKNQTATARRRLSDGLQFFSKKKGKININ